ncbi:MAG: cell division protein FtsH, partial [Gordonibacter sp.]
YGMSAELGTQVFGQPNHEVFLGRDYGNTQDYSEETARRIDAEVACIMKDAHDRAHEILMTHREQMDLMASVLLERETVEGEACQALLDNEWDDYLKREDEINARKEQEEADARARDEKLADVNWRDESVEPGDQDPNPPYREAAEGDEAKGDGENK